MYYRRNYIDMILLLMSITVLTTNLPNCEGNPYPFLNLVSRVSRGPSIRSTEDELDGSSQSSLTSAGRAAFLKSPAFHMRFRPNRYAHVHAPPQPYNFPPASMSSRGSDSSPLFPMSGGLPGINPSESEEILLNDDNKNDSNNHHDSITSSSAAFVGGKLGNSGTGGAADESDSAHELNSEEPTFTPFISARALSNMGKFFEHLRENLVAIRQDDADNSEIGPPERRRIVHSGTSGSGSDDYSQSQKATYTDDDTADEGANHDYNFSSDGKGASSALSMALRWKPPATGEFRGAIPSPLSSDNGSANRLQKIQTFIQPLTDEESYRRRANNYNPSWLWTNMGLGRKRRR